MFKYDMFFSDFLNKYTIQILHEKRMNGRELQETMIAIAKTLPEHVLNNMGDFRSPEFKLFLRELEKDGFQTSDHESIGSFYLEDIVELTKKEVKNEK